MIFNIRYFYYSHFVGTVSLLEATDVFSNDGSELINIPEIGSAYNIFRPFSGPTTGLQWPEILSDGGSMLAWFAHINSNFTGNLLEWNDTLLVIDVLESNSGIRLIRFKFNDLPALKFQIPTTSSDFQRLGFTLRNGVTLSVYTDCTLIRTSDIPAKFIISDNSMSVTIFKDASNSMIPVVRICLFICG